MSFFPVQHANTEKLLEMLLGKTQEVENFKKYRLFQKNPREKHIISALEKSKAIIQTRISKRQRELKETLETMSKYDKSRKTQGCLKRMLKVSYATGEFTTFKFDSFKDSIHIVASRILTLSNSHY